MSFKRLSIFILTLVSVSIFAGMIFLASFFDSKYSGPSIEMQDGTKLVTFVYLPKAGGPFPTLIFRSPYDIPIVPLGGMTPVNYDGVAVEQLGDVGWPEITNAGYALVIQHSRGRVGSEGQALNNTDREDGLELIKWIRSQSWSNGRVGTMGDSAGANLAFLMNAENPEGLQASFAQVGTPNMINETVLGPGGALKLETFLAWLAEHAVSSDDHHFEAIGRKGLNGLVLRASAGLQTAKLLRGKDKANTSDAWRHLPLRNYPAISEVMPAFNRLLDQEHASQDANYFNASKTSKVPTYHVTMWYDVFATAQLNSFERGESNGLEQRLLILNGTHYEIDNPNKWPLQPLLPWFNYWLKDEEHALNTLPRVIFAVANEVDEWYGVETWPPAESKTAQWYLGQKGTLSAQPLPQESSGTRGYTYNPDNPVPTIGGRNLIISHGALDQQPVRGKNRSDVLSYESEILKGDLLLAGHIHGQLSVSSSEPDTDFTMKLLDVHPNGKAILVAEGIIRARYRSGIQQPEFLKPHHIYDVKIDLGHAAWRFKAGHKLAVDVSSSNFPQWDRNLNTAEPLYTSDKIAIANNVVHHGGATMSSINLPLLENTESLQPLLEFKTEMPANGPSEGIQDEG